MEQTLAQINTNIYFPQGIPEQKEAETSGDNNNSSMLLSTICHELRTPLAIIRGYTSLLLDYEESLENTEKHEYIESIDKATSRLAELVDDILDMSRLESGMLHLKKIPTSLTELIRESVVEAQLRAPSHRIQFVMEQDIPCIHIDAKRIRQVLDNILDNAIKYSEKRTDITVRLISRKNDLLVSIEDHGIGIPPCDLTNVFQRMFRVERQITTRTNGAGLGLTICRGLVEAHGGRIWLDSDEGKGSTVNFTVPI